MPNEKIENFSNSKNEVDDITICYEVSREVKEINEFMDLFTTTYICYQHAGLGTSTVYLDSPQP